MKYNEISTFLSILQRDMYIFHQSLLSTAVDMTMQFSTFLITIQYILPLIGVYQKYGSFVFISELVLLGFLDMLGNIATIIADIEGPNTLSYYLTLPSPHWLILLRFALMNMYRSVICSLIILPIGKIILGNYLSLQSFMNIKFICAYIVITIFNAFLSLLLTSITPTVESIHRIRRRIILPLWTFGCAQYSWKTLYKANHILAYINLINPLVYPMELIHSSVLNPADYLPYWLCMSMLIPATMLIAYASIRLLSQRLDCVIT